jgi:hypothetical protein
VGIQEPGPFRYEPAPGPAGGSAVAAPSAAGRYVLENRVVLRQGTTSISGRTLTVQTGGTPARVEGFFVEGRIEAHMAQGDREGSKVTYEAATPGQARLVLDGTGLRVLWRGGARVLSGAAHDVDLGVTTSGRAMISHLPPGQDRDAAQDAGGGPPARPGRELPLVEAQMKV